MPRNCGTQLKRTILDEARRILLQDGYPALSTRRIASAVGCTATSIYLYFQNKDALIHALIDEGFEQLHAAFQAADPGPGDPVARLDALCRAYVDFGLNNREYYEIMFLLHPARMERYPVERYRAQRSCLECIGDAIGEARGHELDGAGRLRAATLVWSSLHGLIALTLAARIDKSLRGSGQLDEELLDEAVQLARGLAIPADVHP